MSTKVCIKCTKEKDVELFRKDKRKKSGRGARCLECHNQYYHGKTYESKRQYAKERQHSKRYTELRHHMAKGQWWEMMLAQGSKCANPNCSKVYTEEASKEWHVDHDHKCCPSIYSECGQCVRWIMCSDCNAALGRVRDDIKILQGLIQLLTG